MSSSNKILSVYNSRNTLVSIARTKGYNADDYDSFSINEIDAMYKNNQLDMLLSHNETERKIYIKYYLKAKQIKKQDLDDIIEDLYFIDNVLKKEDVLVVVTEFEPNDTIIAKIKYLFEHDDIFIVIHNIKRLQYNILNHTLVPSHSVLTEGQQAEIYVKYNIKNDDQLPQISRFDPVSQIIGLRPGELCEIIRPSKTAITSKYYRICLNE